MKNRNNMKTIVSTVLVFSALAGCSEAAGTGELRVLLEPEDVIIDGLDPGTEGESVRDGWEIRFDEYIVSIGDIEVQLTTDASISAAADELFVIDLTQASAGGESLWELSELEQGRWEFHYATLDASADAQRHASVSEADFDAMVAEGWTYLITGTLAQADGQSCPPAALATPPDGLASSGQNSAGDPCYPAANIGFELGVSAPTRFGPCEVDGTAGFSVTAGAQTSVAITIHGDHLFFNGFPEGAEGGVLRLAQWLADCDLDLDGVVTRAELEAIAPSQLAEIDDRFQLGGSPITPLDNMWTYVVAQLQTQGHFQGEGECPLAGAGPG
jgi:hypothetical protein